MKVGIIEFPGTNCEREAAAAVRRAGMTPVPFRWNKDPGELEKLDGYIIAGGFSYEDRSRSGIIAALDPLMPSIKREIEKGKPIIGICNGAQILLETGMVPGLPVYHVGAALAANRRVKDGNVLGTGFYNAWVHIKYDDAPKNCAFTSALTQGQTMHIPAAHAEGRFIIPDSLLEKVIAQKMTVFRYSDENGNIDDEFPINPNGSVYNIAGICNPAGNVLALMPHPERTEGGDKIFTSMRNYIENRQNSTLDISRINRAVLTEKDIPEPAEVMDSSYQCPEKSKEVIVELIITDNEAVSVENALRHRNIPVSIRRRTHWELSFSHTAATPGADDAAENTTPQAEASGELYNSNKEVTCTASDIHRLFSRSLLIRDFTGEDTLGEHKTHALKNWFGISGISRVQHSSLWTIIPDTQNVEEAERLCDAAEKTHIFSNPYANRRYLYE